MRLAVLALVLVLAGCGNSTAAGSALRGHTYLSDSVTGRSLAPGTRVSLKFTDDGRLVAGAGCNTMSGPVTVDGDKLVLDDLPMTVIACDQARQGQDKWLYDLLGGNPTWRLDGSTLHITAGSTEIVLSEPKAAGLTGTTWELDTIVDGDLASSTSAKATLEFTGQKVTVFTGCNTGSAQYQMSGQRLHVSTVAITRKACPPDLTQAEQAVLATLDGDVDFKIDGTTLTLTNPSGAGLRLTAK
jgi:heat shock protein HslJ